MALHLIVKYNTIFDGEIMLLNNIKCHNIFFLNKDELTVLSAGIPPMYLNPTAN